MANSSEASQVDEKEPPSRTDKDASNQILFPADNTEMDEKSLKSPPGDAASSEKDHPENEPHQALPAEPPIERSVSSGDEYSVLTVTQKKLVVFTASLASVFSPMATAIYYPSLNTIASDLHVSNAKINITVTLFLVIQGIAPAFVADIADKAGRRPMYILCFIIFTGANIGLALQDDYVPLLILRMLQSAGSSGTVALANGVVGDIITSSERGTYIAYASLGAILGPMASPILGGVIGQYAGWHFIFWFLIISSCAIFIPLILFLPETCRNVVDNGSIPPPFYSSNITDSIRHKRREKAGLGFNEAKQAELTEKYRFMLPNPLTTVLVLADLESAMVLTATGLGLGCYYAISTGASVAFTALYGFNQVQISLMFIPIGAGSIVSAFSCGKLVDWNFRRHSKLLGLPVVKNRKQDLTNFPIEKARLQIAFPLFFIGGAFLIAYGWIITVKVSIAAPIIFLFFTGFGLTATFQILNILMVDIYPGKPSVATAANNFVRCEIGAVFSAIILPLSNAIGRGWAYSILAFMFMASAPMLLILMSKGPAWRRERKAREDKARDARLEKAQKRELGH